MSTDHTPFPALTPSQRLHLEIYGYVVLEKLLTEAEIAALLEVIYRIEADFQRTGQLPGASCYLSSSTREFFRIDNLPHLAPCFYEYLTHPRILGMAEEIVGGTVRLEQSDAHIRRPGGEQKHGFHRGINPAYAHTGNGLYHFSFVKALTNLTDLGPDDGGTTVIPGTHKIPQEVDGRAIIDCGLGRPCARPPSRSTGWIDAALLRIADALLGHHPLAARSRLNSRRLHPDDVPSVERLRPRPRIRRRLTRGTGRLAHRRNQIRLATQTARFSRTRRNRLNG